MHDFTRYRWIQFAIVGSLYFLVCLHRVSPTVITKDLANSFNADAVMLGIISSSYFYLYSAVQPVVGYLSDTAGSRKVIFLFSLIAALGALIFGTAPNALVATIGRALVGAGVGGVFIPALKLFSNWYRANEFASLTGIMIAIGGIGGLAATLPLTYMVVLFGWRGAFLILGVFSLALACACWLYVKNTPREKGWSAVAAVGQFSGSSGEQEAPAHTTVVKRLAIILGTFDFWMITLSMFFTGGAFLSFQGLWAVPYLMDVFGFSRISAGWMLMLLPFGFAVGGPVFGIFTDRLNLNRKIILLAAMGVSTAGWAILFFLKFTPYSFVVAFLFLIFGLSAGGTLPLCFTITKDLFPPWLMGTAVGLSNPSAFFGAALYQPLTGYLLSRFSGLTPGVYSIEAYRHLILVFLISFAISFICILLLSSRKKTFQ
ncbi:MAG: MFS transporter [Syntrophales bacterium]|jgi:MFS family permease|nr:MFS transporter [Syntrophales bacterium]MDY0045757.1 MFS transporter [Syntrophales bacterium]